jgi:serine/threonine-protein kinase
MRPIGTVLDGRWELQARLGTGSFSQVYRASDRVGGGLYAVKLLGDEASLEAQVRFRAEYDLLRTIHHPRIVRGRAAGVVDGKPYMVLDYAPGGSVTALLQDAGPLPLGRAIEIAVGVLGGLAAAHARGVIHRDVKPGNVLLGEHGEALLCDFGIARAGAGHIPLSSARQTMDNVSLGTLLYMAPEQRLDARNVDLTADLYSTACLLYRLVTDESPVDLFDAPPDDPRWALVPPALRAALQRATRAAPHERFADARTMADALLRLLPASEQAAIRSRPGCDPADFDIPRADVRPLPPPVVVPGPVDPRAPSPWPWRVGTALTALVAVWGIVALLVR